MASTGAAVDAGDKEGTDPTINPESAEVAHAGNPKDADAGDATKLALNESVEETLSESQQSGKMTLLSAEAPAFVPGATVQVDGVNDGPDESDVRAILPSGHRDLLRQGYHAMSGEWVAYHVGRLKSFSNRTGYGFIECAQSYTDYGVDVFIHKNSMINPWHIGQPLEFAVICNGRGQPQATDVNWLPRLPLQPKSSALTPTAPPPLVAAANIEDAPVLSGGGDDGLPVISSAAGTPQASNRTATAGSADAAAGGSQSQSPSAASQPASRSASVSTEPRRLGTLKSFSPAQGYGFIACEEVFSNYQRDVYFDKSQLPSNNWHFGQTVEFVVIHNARGHPQARQIDWDPVPSLQQAREPGAASVFGGTTTTSASGGSNQRMHSSQTLSNLRKLLRHLHELQQETAVVQAINLQGGSNATGGGSEPDADTDIDYVTFVLDRLGPEAEAVPKIKDFVKMLLLLMLAKMLRSQMHPGRCQQNIRWFEALSQTIEPAAESVREHFQSVVEQINNQLQSAHRENQMLREDTQLPVLQAAFRQLQSKSTGLQGPGPAA
mmetsp:Transcript_81237/g.161147  ORF Transcript_81237/g.161147 Transcript_81237/m.161147 type:complete len:551 (-) Transcript_81237:117-1769(-)